MWALVERARLDANDQGEFRASIRDYAAIAKDLYPSNQQRVITAN